MTHLLDRFKLRVYDAYSNTMLYPGDGRTDVAVTKYDPDTGEIRFMQLGLSDYDWEVLGCEYNAETAMPRSDPGRAPMLFMQCTGVPDQQGRLIYEGDVLEWLAPRDGAEPMAVRGVVSWFALEAQLTVANTDPARAGGELHHLSFRHPWTIIGNVHQHPELGEAPTPFTAALFTIREMLELRAPRVKLVVKPADDPIGPCHTYQIWNYNELVIEQVASDEMISDDRGYRYHFIDLLLKNVPINLKIKPGA